MIVSGTPSVLRPQLETLDLRVTLLSEHTHVKPVPPEDRNWPFVYNQLPCTPPWHLLSPPSITSSFPGRRKGQDAGLTLRREPEIHKYLISAVQVYVCCVQCTTFTGVPPKAPLLARTKSVVKGAGIWHSGTLL